MTNNDLANDLRRLHKDLTDLQRYAVKRAATDMNAYRIKNIAHEAGRLSDVAGCILQAFEAESDVMTDTVQALRRFRRSQLAEAESDAPEPPPPLTGDLTDATVRLARALEEEGISNMPSLTGDITESSVPSVAESIAEEVTRRVLAKLAESLTPPES
jgi:hypothetical protein